MAIRVCSAGVLMALASAGCSPDGGSADGRSGASSTGGGAASSATGGAGGGGVTYSGGTGSTGVDFGGGLESGGAGGAGIAPEELCNSLAVKPELIEVEVEVEVPVEVPFEVEVPVEVPFEVVEEHPTAIYIMLDRSGSMSGSSWTTAVSAIGSFVSDPASAGLQVALQYFPLDPVYYGVAPYEPGVAACTDATGAPHDTPAVAMGVLPANAGPIQTSLNATGPGVVSLTPTEPALRGVTSYCAAFMASNPDWNCVSVFVTDGEPTLCNVDMSFVSSIAGTAYDGSGVTTFAVGMTGANFQGLDLVAAAGHGDCNAAVAGYQACDVTTGPTAFLDALNRIRETVSIETRTETRTEIQTRTEYETHYETQVQRTPLICEWAIPPAPEGETFDKDKVNVRVTLGGGAVEDLGRVPSPADCTQAAAGSWYYDDPASPTRILLCDGTCTTIEADTDPLIDILLGCETKEVIVK